MNENEAQGPNGKIWLLIILILAILIVAIAFWSNKNKDFLNYKGNTPVVTPTREAKIYTVFYDLDIFSPTNLRIHAGDTVRFQNDSNKKVRVITDSVNNQPGLPGFDSTGDVLENGVFSYTFIKSGIFGYHNYYDANQGGVVTVRP